MASPVDSAHIIKMAATASVRILKDPDVPRLNVLFKLVGATGTTNAIFRFAEDGYDPIQIFVAINGSPVASWSKLRLRASCTLTCVTPTTGDLYLLTQNGNLAVPSQRSLDDPDRHDCDFEWMPRVVDSFDSDGASFLQIAPPDLRNPELVRLEQMVLRRSMERENALMDEIMRLREGR